MSDLVARQPNELGPNLMKPGMKVSRCFCCKQPIEVGQEYFHIPASLYNQRRHTTCTRRTPGCNKRITRIIGTRSDGFSKRRRGGLDGWSEV